MERVKLEDQQKVRYCIPIPLRDEQIRHACRVVKDRVEPYEGPPRTEPIAVVGFGPSLRDTWELIWKYRYIMTCSGSHKFLIERGTLPNWHVEVDPRAHKVELLGKPNWYTEYLIASTCHPLLFKHLEGHLVKLWHVFDASESGAHVLPRGEWSFTGGCDVGMRAMTLAATLGFKELHIFGIDGCAQETQLHHLRRHADGHPNEQHDTYETEFDGKTYFATAGMMEAAKQVFHELDEMPTVKATFFGDGLVQAMAKQHVPSVIGSPLRGVVGYSLPELISKEYRALNEQLHADNPEFGLWGAVHAGTIDEMASRLETTSVLDYGCGKGTLGRELQFPIWEYDPAIPGKAEAPRPADIVVCTDVLEHIEPDKLKYVLNDLQRCVVRCGYFVIALTEAKKSYADGRNTHLIIEPMDWWTAMLAGFFEVVEAKQHGEKLFALVAPKTAKAPETEETEATAETT